MTKEMAESPDIKDHGNEAGALAPRTRRRIDDTVHEVYMQQDDSISRNRTTFDFLVTSASQIGKAGMAADSSPFQRSCHYKHSIKKTETKHLH